MAAKSEIVKRRAKVANRIAAASAILAEYHGIALPPAFPNTSDPEHRQNNELERIAIALERMVEAISLERMEVTA